LENLLVIGFVSFPPQISIRNFARALHVTEIREAIHVCFSKAFL